MAKNTIAAGTDSATPMATTPNSPEKLATPIETINNCNTNEGV